MTRRPRERGSVPRSITLGFASERGSSCSLCRVASCDAAGPSAATHPAGCGSAESKWEDIG